MRLVLISLTVLTSLLLRITIQERVGPERKKSLKNLGGINSH